MATRRVLVELLADDSSLLKGFAKGEAGARSFGRTLNVVTRQTGGFSRGFLSGAGALSSFGGALALTSGSFFAGAGLVAGLKASVDAAGNFQQIMQVLAQQTGGTASQLKSAAAEAKALGADITLPATSATDAATAMLQLAKGGLTLKQAMAATRGTLQLAAAAQTDVGTASNETARALTTFNLSGGHAGEIADLLANGAASATGDIQDFALALSQSGTSAHQFGLTARDTVTAITELAKSGILGSDAGTSLRVMLTRLLPTSKAAQREIKRLGISVHDASGNFLPFREIVSQYSKQLAKLSPAERQHALQVIFGTDAQRAANIILTSGVKNFDNLSAAVSKQGGAAARAAAQQQGFKGVVDGLNSAIQTTEVNIGTALLPVLTRYLRELSKWLSDTRNQEKIQRDATKAVQDFAKAVSAIASGVKTVASAFDVFSKAVGGTRNALGLLAGAFVAFKFRNVLSNLGLMGTGFKNIGNEAKIATKQVNTLKKAQEGLNAEQAVGNNPFIFGNAGNPFNKSSQIPNTDLRDKQSFFDRIFGGTFAAKTFANQGKLGGGGLILPGISPDSHKGVPLTPGMVIKQGNNKFIVLEINGGIAIMPLEDFKNLPTIKGRSIVDRINPRATVPNSGAFVAPSARDFPLPTTTTTPKVKLTATQRNTFFDNDIARLLLRGGLGTIKQQTAAINQAIALLTARIAATKDITRKKNLEDQVLQLLAQRKDLATQLATQAADAISASLAFGLEKAQATSSFKDDLAALNAINANIEQRIKTEGRTTDLLQQLFENRQKIRDTQQQQRDAAQFFALGLSPTGAERTPRVPRLKQEASAITNEITGTFLDTAKNRGRLSAINKILNSTIPPSDAVRQAIQSYFDTIDQELKKGGRHLTKFKKVSQDALLAGLGLDPATKRRIEQRLAGVGAGGTRPGGSSASFAGAGAKVPPINTVVYLDGKKVADNTSDHQSRTSKNRSSTRRGPYAGRH